MIFPLALADLCRQVEAHVDAVSSFVFLSVPASAALQRQATETNVAHQVPRAERIRALSTQAIDGFAHGAANGGVESDAKADIWNNFEDFRARLDDFINEAKALDETARGGDEAKMKEQFHKTAETCKACHDKYKAS